MQIKSRPHQALNCPYVRGVNRLLKERGPGGEERGTRGEWGHRADAPEASPVMARLSIYWRSDWNGAAGGAEGGSRGPRACTSTQGPQGLHLNTGAPGPAPQHRGPRACTSTQGQHLNTGPAPQHRACTSTQGPQGLHLNTGPAPQHRASTSTQGLHLNTGPDPRQI